MNFYLLTFEQPDALISMNEKDSMNRTQKQQVWRDAAFWAFVRDHPGVGPSGRAKPPSVVKVSLPVPDHRRRDPINFSKTVKHIVDGLVNAGAWPDDTPEWCDQRTPHLRHTTDKHPLVIVRLEPM